MAPAPVTLRLGTRASLLAVAQSRLVADAMTGADASVNVELVRIETRGDRNQLTPLDQVNDPNFFSDEIDEALQNGVIDFAVHSLKDLGEVRPAFIETAAILRRENPRDVVLFRDDIIERLRAGQPVRIGSSSARRQHNVAAFLHDALPRVGPEPDLQFVPLRGPVDQRITKVTQAADSDGALDGVVLALAGLARLWSSREGRASLLPHLDRVRPMVLPLCECPAAPGQGALIVECRREDARTRSLLAHLHDDATARCVARELESLNALPVNERSAHGATAIEHPVLGALMFQRGGNDAAPLLEWRRPPRPDQAIAWDGGQLAAGPIQTVQPAPLEPDPGGAVFIAHWRAAGALRANSNARIWTSGIASWKKLSAKGYWVEGCAENLGYEFIVPTLECPVLQLPPPAAWTVLTRCGAEPSWDGAGPGRVIGSYTVNPPAGIEVHRTEVCRATDFYWGSIEQFRAVRDWLPPGARHACGAGKTARALKADGVDAPLIFPSRREWQAWLP